MIGHPDNPIIPFDVNPLKKILPAKLGIKLIMKKRKNRRDSNRISQ